ncbi:MAG: class I SAM-dependent methyltransferase [Gemmataceae bacterium]
MGFFPIESASSSPSRPSSIQWEECACLLCGSQYWKPLLEAPDALQGESGLWFAVVQCQNCGLCYTNPRPDAGSIQHFYPASYRPHQTSEPRRQRKWKLTKPWRGARKERHFLTWHGQGRLLDFGCGGGSFLRRVHDQGWQVTGIDVSSDAVARIRAEFGLHALVGSLPHEELSPESFDVITMWHVLEHVHEPLRILREAQRLLVPGGHLYVAVPNIDSLPFRWFKQYWFGLDLPRHLTHFTPPSLQLMLEHAHFRVGPIHMIRHTEWLRRSALRACQQPRHPYWFRWLRHRPIAGLATCYASAIGQADSMLVRCVKE